MLTLALAAPPISACARALLDVVRANNNAAAAAASARAFVVDGTTVGRVLPKSAAALGRYAIFDVSEEAITLRGDAGATLEERSKAVTEVICDLRAEGSVPMLDGWRDEAFAVRTSFFASPSLVVERAAAGLFGAPAYGVS